MSSALRRASIALGLAAAGCAASGPALAFADPPTPPGRRVTAVRIEGPVTLDGRLDEPAWQLAEPAADFLQQEPDEGLPSTEPSEVRFLYDDEALYVGGVFHDASGERGIIVDELKRDFAGRNGDLVALVLDPWLDRRNAVTFLTNPGGAVGDAQSHNDGRQKNQDWNGVWSVRTSRDPRGWTVEMAIPFRTLRFPDRDVQLWGVNVLRVIRRKNEIALWSPVPRQFNELKVSYAGLLDGIANVHPGRNLRIKPHATAAAERASGQFGGRADAGVDVKFGGAGLTWDLTYRSDFSQVEADEQQINLTRASLFLPEKREFFLENQGALQVGDETGRSSRLLPFFSRRIGLSADGQPVDVIGGARVTGSQGAYGVGVLAMSTARAAADGAEHYLAARLTRRLGANHSIGGLYLAREGADANRVGGLDLHLGFRGSTEVDAYVLRSDTPDTAERGWAGRAAVDVKERRHTTSASYTNIGAGYRNDLGFVARDATATVAWEHEWNLRPRSASGWARLITIGGEGEWVAESDHSLVLSRLIRHDYSVELPDGSRLGVDLNWNHERLTAPDEVAPGRLLGAGEYRFQNVAAAYRSDPSRTFSSTVELTAGDFWSGRIRGVEATARLRASAHLAVSAAVEHNRIALDDGPLETTVARGRLDWSLTTRMFLNALVQYNSASRARTTNVRFNFIHHPLSDLFVVVNETARPSGTTRAVALKFTQLLSF